MKSGAHLLISLVVGVLAVVASPAPVSPVVALLGAVAVGVLIDLDHFVLARYNTGTWHATRRVLASPELLFTGQDEIFDQTDVWRIQRLLSHFVVATIAVPAIVVAAPAYAPVVAAALYAHVGADLVADARTEREYVRRSAEALER
jgi:hypothetical protein